MDNLLYRLGRRLFKFFFFIFHRRKIYGLENVPESGPVIIMANHISYLDPPLIGSILDRQVFFIAKKELFKNKLFEWVFDNLGVIPIKRGKADLGAIRSAFKVLRSEQVLGIFPEGTRHEPDDMGQAQPGSVTIAIKSQAPIVPIGIKDISGLQKTKVSVGKPFKLEQFFDKKINKDVKKEAGQIIMAKIKDEIKKIT